MLPDPLPRAGIELTIRLSRDYHVRVAGVDYSIDPQAIGRVVTVTAGLTTVHARCGGMIVAEHERCLRPHQTITDPAHVAQAARLRHQYQDAHHGGGRPVLSVVETRDLASYDQLWQEVA